MPQGGLSGVHGHSGGSFRHNVTFIRHSLIYGAYTRLLKTLLGAKMTPNRQMLYIYRKLALSVIWDANLAVLSHRSKKSTCFSRFRGQTPKICIFGPLCSRYLSDFGPTWAKMSQNEPKLALDMRIWSFLHIRSRNPPVFHVSGVKNRNMHFWAIVQPLLIGFWVKIA